MQLTTSYNHIRAFSLALLLLVAVAKHFAPAVARGCRFPEHWTGLWFQKGAKAAIRLEEDTFTFKGTCVDSLGHMFLIEDSREKCFRCIVIYEKHLNVLQYRETYCDEYGTLEQACQGLNVDAHLYSMFRVGASPIHCPFKGPFTFKYSRGQGECAYPMSTIDSCTDDTRILFRFQACAEVLGTESSVEELTCLAKWKEGSAYYLVGKMAYRKAHAPAVYSESDSYRCFVYEHLSDGTGFQVSQSADATCDGLVSPREGSRIMRLNKDRHPSVGCEFPWWATAHRWHTLNGHKVYVFTHSNTTLRISPHPDSGSAIHQAEAKITCIEDIGSTSNTSVFVGYTMSGCDNGYICITLHRRDSHIIEIQTGKSEIEFLCVKQVNKTIFKNPSVILQGDARRHVFLTRIQVRCQTPSPGVAPCPHLSETNGLRVHSDHLSFRPEMCRADARVAVTACRTHNTIEFLTSCNTFRDTTIFRCHGEWREKGRSFLILGVKGSKAKYCLVYSSSAATHISGLHDTCHRNAPPSGMMGNITFNISDAGDCEHMRTTRGIAPSPNEASIPFLLVTLIVAVLLMR